jgi:hypothetical protein
MKNTPLLFLFLALAAFSSVTVASEARADSADACRSVFTLPNNQWRQISLPCVPPAGQASVADVFGDDIAEAFSQATPSYGSNWIVYQYATSGYQSLSETDSLKVGVGYWIIQKSNGEAKLDLPATSMVAPSVQSNACPSAQGCFEITLDTNANVTGWNMVGYPGHYDPKLGNMRISTSSSDCSNGCDLGTAQRDGLVHGQFWSYNGSGYTVASNPGGELDPWQGYWVATLPGADGKAPRLLVPKVGGFGDSVYEGGESPESAQEIPLNQDVSLRPIYDTEWNNKPQKYGNYKFDVEKDGEITLDIQAAKVGASWIQVKEASQGTVVTETWVANDSSGTTDSFKVKAGETYRFFINKNGANTETIGLKVNFSASHFEFPWDHGKLVTDRRMLKHEDGTGFFWMGDTAWDLARNYILPASNIAHPLSQTNIDTYLENRAKKGFTVIQMVALKDGPWLSKSTVDYAPFVNQNFTKLKSVYWSKVDYIVNKAKALGLYVALLPAWGGTVTTTTDARNYGKAIAERYKDDENIIWVVGGDDSNGSANKAIWDTLGTAIQETVGQEQLITYHPAGGSSSSELFANSDWIDFHMVQSGHCGTASGANGLFLGAYDSTSKPILDGEPRYETIEECFHKKDRSGYRFNEHDVREMAYLQVFSGAFGHTYGHQSIWQMYQQGNKPQAGSVIKTWDEALNDPGAVQMEYLVKLMKSRDILSRVPDQSLVISGSGIATRGEGYAFVYLPKGGSVDVNLGNISGENIKAWWYNPRTGSANAIGTYVNGGTQSFSTAVDKDMVLVIDDASKGYQTPGS